jgi:hypothetical protein
MIIGSKNNLDDLKKLEIGDLVIGGNKILRDKEKEDKKIKNLGVIFDETFTWEQHISSLIKKAYAKLRQFYSYRKSLSIKTKTRLIETYVLSQLNYCDVVIQGTTNSEKERLQRVQNSCIRYIFGLRKYDHITPYLQKLKTLNIKNRTRSHAITLMHKIVNKSAPVYLSDKLSYRHQVHNHNTRNRNLLNVRRLRTAKKNEAFFVKTVNEYNTLVANKTISVEDSPNCLKSKVKRHLMQEAP